MHQGSAASASTLEFFRKAVPETYPNLLNQNLHVKILVDHFSKEDMQMASRHMKIPLVIRGMQIKTTVRYYFILTNMDIINENRK